MRIIIGRVAVLSRCGLLLHTWSVHLLVCLSATIVSPAKTAEPTEMPFGVWTRLGQTYHVLDGVAHCKAYREYRPCAAAMRPFVKLL